VSAVVEWLDRHTRDAPPALRARVFHHALATSSTADLPATLALAGREALEQVTAHPGDRSVALDLLAADALITLALLAQAQRSPGELARFATAVLQAVRPGT
jgi:hypothetical protein